MDRICLNSEKYDEFESRMRKEERSYEK